MSEKLIIENLTKKFGKNEGVENINLSVKEHELLTLLGPSGCGKTTILRAIGGFNQIDSGRILLDGIRGQMREELKRIQREAGLTVIFVTHDQEEAMAISDRIAVMRRGYMEQIGTPDEIYDHPKTRFVAEFIGEMNFIEENGSSFAVRPEDVTLQLDQNGKYEIFQMMSLGHYTQAIVKKSEKEILKVFLEKDQAKGFETGNRVSCIFDRQQEFAARA